MTEQPLLLPAIYQGWHTYQTLLTKALAPLPPARGTSLTGHTVWDRARGTPALRPAQRGAGVALAQHPALALLRSSGRTPAPRSPRSLGASAGVGVPRTRLRGGCEAAPLSADQLALGAAPALRSIGEIATHTIGARARWFDQLMGEGGDAFAARETWDRKGMPAPDL